MDVFRKIENNIKICKRNVPLSLYNTFGIGGKCEMLVEPTNDDEIFKTVAFCKQNDVSYKIIGCGSNLLVSDGGFDGVSIRLGNTFSDIKIKNNHLLAKAGASTKKVYNACVENGLGGVEFLATLPSTVGGAVAMNAGCFGSEAKDVVFRVWATDGEKTFVFDKSQLCFGYRTSLFLKSQLVITQIEFELLKQDDVLTRQNFAKLLMQKRKTQPLGEKSAGCFFKKAGGISAGYYIDKCGLKGFRIGGAEVSQKHAGFIINKGWATCNDVLRLVDIIYTQCKDTFGVCLEPEVDFLGRTDDFRRLSYTYRIQPR